VPPIRWEDVRAVNLISLEFSRDEFGQVKLKQFISLEAKKSLRSLICLDAPPRPIGDQDSIS
jgi:hypothetical protein